MALRLHQPMQGRDTSGGERRPTAALLGALKRQQSKALEGPLGLSLQNLEHPGCVVSTLTATHSQKDLYLLLLALVKVRI